MPYHIVRIVIILILCFTFSILGLGFYRFLNRPVIPAGQTLSYTLDKGKGLMNLAYDLQRLGVIDDPKIFIWFAQLRGWDKNLHAGTYEFKGPVTELQILREVVSGKTVLKKLTIIEGRTFADVMNSVRNAPDLTHTLTSNDPAQIMLQLGLKGEFPEGRFYPDTYHFSPKTKDVDFLLRAYHTMQKKLADAWQMRQANLPYTTPYEALIVASLIEKETAINAEKAEIAGVIVRRLQKGMLLQIDPTVIYGLGASYKGTLVRSDLKIDSPYNTYLHKGLPPTPIAMPSLTSIQAALNPASGTTYYYVARGDGGHVFSQTYEQHSVAVKQYYQHRKKYQQDNKQLLPLVIKPNQRLSYTCVVPEYLFDGRCVFSEKIL